MTVNPAFTSDGAPAPQPAEAALRLPRPPGVFRRWLAAHPKAVDRIIVGTYLFGCLLMVAFELLVVAAANNFDEAETGFSLNAEGSPLPLMTVAWSLVRLAITAVTVVALLHRRTHPFIGVIVVTALLVFEQGALVAPNIVAVYFLLWAVPVFQGVARGWVAYAIVTLLHSVVIGVGITSSSGVLGPAGVMLGPVDTSESSPLVVLNALWLLVVLMSGISMGNRRRYVDALIDRAQQLAREREQEAQLAAASERARIAREMHDIVAHSLSVVVTLAEAASVSVDSRPEAAKQAMERASDTGRTALVEMRRLLGVLNDDSQAGATMLAPQPGAAQLQQLVQGFRDAGLHITLTEQGVTRGGATHELAVYRIVQEALTNALRYAGRGAHVTATIEHRPEATHIEVTDRGAMGPVPTAAASIPGSGRGLAGAAERAKVFGGTLDAGTYQGGWRVRATVPYAAEATEQEQV